MALLAAPGGPPTQMARQDQSQDITISVVVNDIAGRPIQDGIVHWFTVVAVDLWQNKDLENVTIVEATSVANVAPQPPERITNIEAWDTPDDDGTSIDVSWTPSFDRDLDHYVSGFLNTQSLQSGQSGVPVLKTPKNVA